MQIRKEFNEAAVLVRIQERAGFRYQSSQLANYFGISTARMTVVLTKLHATRQIRRVRCSGNPTMYYLPTEKELEAELRLGERKAIPEWVGIVCAFVEGEEV